VKILGSYFFAQKSILPNLRGAVWAKLLLGKNMIYKRLSLMLMLFGNISDQEERQKKPTSHKH